MSSPTPNTNSLLTSFADYGKILGASGTRNVFGFITNEEHNPQLYWRRGIDIFDLMRTSDATVRGMLTAIKNPLLSATYDVLPASDDPDDQFIAEHIKNEIFNRNIKWRKFLELALGKCDFGFSVFEKTYEWSEYKGKKLVGIKELGWRKQWSILKWATSRNEPGITQELLSGPVDIPQEKLLIFVNDQEGDNYQGRSMLRYIYGAWDMKRTLENLVMVAAMRSLGFPIVKYFDENDKKDHDRIEKILQNFHSHEQQYMMIAAGKYEFDWGKIETNIKTDLLPAIEHFQKEIDKSVLAQFLDLGGSTSSSSGSRALSQDHSQLFEKSMVAIINEIIDEINTNLIQQLCDFNWSSLPNGYPKLVCTNIGDQDISMLAEAINRLGTIDMLTPDPDLEDKLREILGLPKVPQEIRDGYYTTRITAQSKAQPLTQPGQTDANGQPIQPNDAEPLKPKKKDPANGPAADEENRETFVNQKSDMANKPAPYPNPPQLQPRSAKASQALEDLKRARVAAMQAYMEV